MIIIHFFSLLELKLKACRIVTCPVLPHCGFYHFMHRVNNKLGHLTFKKNEYLSVLISSPIPSP